MTDTLKAEDFVEFSQQISGRDPFPWQVHLVQQVLDCGTWPATIDVPTGLGKTSLIDSAVFVSAASATATATVNAQQESSLLRRRLLFVVDRRLIVDEATAHARKLRDVLAGYWREPDGSVAARVAGAIAHMFRTDDGQAPKDFPLAVLSWRGGANSDSSDDAGLWTGRPDQPAIIMSTVDHLGSRLFFRGYGVSRRRRSLEAAFVGSDALLLLDEAHLARPFLTTLASIGPEAMSRAGTGRLPKLTVVSMSATTASHHVDADSWSFSLDEKAHGIGVSPPLTGAVAVAKQRLTANKRLTLLQSEPKRIPVTMAELALDLGSRLGKEGCLPRVLVVCNTVDRARAVHVAIQQMVTRRKLALSPQLLIGRARSVDRQELDRQIIHDFGLENAPAGDGNSQPKVLVATQTVEVGVNLDVDALITESASWDALVQRLGRLNRLGTFNERFSGLGAAPAIVVHDGAPGPVYGQERELTWALLAGRSAVVQEVPSIVQDLGESGIDVSPVACREWGKAFAEARRQQPGFEEDAVAVPLATPPILDRWVRTAPEPTVDPALDQYLHGFNATPAAVTVAWRSGLLRPAGTVDLDDEDLPDERRATALTAAMPIQAAETIEVPLTAFRRWMSGLRPTVVSDLEGAEEETGPDRQIAWSFPVFQWEQDGRGEERWRLVEAAAIRPGDRVLVPVERGGLDEYGWNPECSELALDAGEWSGTSDQSGVAKPKLLLRLDAQLPKRLGIDDIRPVQRAIRHVRKLVTGVADDDGVELSGQTEEPIVKDAVVDVTEVPSTRHQAIDRLMFALDEKLAELDFTQDECAPRARWRSRVRDHVRAHVESGARPEYVITPVWERPPGTSEDDAGGGNLLTLTLRLKSQRFRANAAVEDPLGTSINQRVTLRDHSLDVRHRAGTIAANVGLPADVCSVIADAAQWHDLGKAESRFQVSLHAGNAMLASIADEPLAKSGMDPADPAQWHAARRLSELPRGARHEAWSAALVNEFIRTYDYPGDGELLVHLVASHHGHARALLPAVNDSRDNTIEATIAGSLISISTPIRNAPDAADRFARLNMKYGPWGVALMEAVLRTADTSVSAGYDRGESCHRPEAELRTFATTQTSPELPAVELPGIDGRKPVGFLAALGVLRLLQQSGWPNAALSWSARNFTPRIHGTELTLEGIVDELTSVVAAIPKGRVLPFVSVEFPPKGEAPDKLRVDPADLRRKYRNWSNLEWSESDPHHLAVLDAWLCSLVTDTSTDNGKRVMISNFTAPSGKQSMWTMLQKPLDQVRAEPGLLREALIAWRRYPGVTGEYLDNAAVFDAAHASDGKPSMRGVPGATWLALMSYPLFLTTTVNGRVMSSGWHQVPGRRVSWFVYPLWSEPVGVSGVQALLEHPGLAAGRGTAIGQHSISGGAMAPLSVFWICAAERQKLFGAKSAGVLAPVDPCSEAAKEWGKSGGRRRKRAERPATGPKAAQIT